jgi:carboxymethylenebutenolidase
MDHQSVLLPGPDGLCPADEVIPDGEARGAVIVLHEAFGVNDHIIDVCQRFAAIGYRAVAPQLFHRDGVRALPYDLEQAQPHMAKLAADGIRSDLAAVQHHLATGPTDRTGRGFPLSLTGIVGFCMGGSITCAVAAEDAYGAAVTFYGSGMHKGRFGFRPLVELAPGLRSPWLGLYGDLDPGIPVQQVEDLRSAAATARVPSAVVRYAEAGHGFHSDARPANYHERSANDAWMRTLDWFGRYLAPDSAGRLESRIV